MDDTGPAEDVRDRERIYTNQDPARPGGGRSNSLAIGAYSLAFIAIVMLLWYARQGC